MTFAERSLVTLGLGVVGYVLYLAVLPFMQSAATAALLLVSSR